MGLDTSHDCWHGAYGAFTRFRHALAEAAGYEIAKIERDMFPRVIIDWAHLPQGALYGEWDKTPDDPLIVLIAHSDCEGLIKPEQALPLAKRLEELKPLLKDEGEGHIWNYREVAQRFADGLRAAAKKGEDVNFH